MIVQLLYKIAFPGLGKVGDIFLPCGLPCAAQTLPATEALPTSCPPPLPCKKSKKTALSFAIA